MEKPRIQFFLFGTNDIIATSGNAYPYKMSNWGVVDVGLTLTDTNNNTDVTSTYLTNSYYFYYREGEYAAFNTGSWLREKDSMNDDVSGNVNGDYRLNGNNFIHKDVDL